jgi:hypothetical protein
MFSSLILQKKEDSTKPEKKPDKVAPDKKAEKNEPEKKEPPEKEVSKGKFFYFLVQFSHSNLYRLCLLCLLISVAGKEEKEEKKEDKKSEKKEDAKIEKQKEKEEQISNKGTSYSLPFILSHLASLSMLLISYLERKLRNAAEEAQLNEIIDDVVAAFCKKAAAGAFSEAQKIS